MECREYRKMVRGYIKDELSINQIDEFLRHIKTCKNCREELEVNFIIEHGLDRESLLQDNMDFEHELEEKIRSSYVRMHMLHSWKVFKYAWNTLIALGVILAFCIQIRLWMS